MNVCRRLTPTVLLLLTVSLPLLAAPRDRNSIQTIGGADGDRFHAVIESDGTLFYGGLKNGTGTAGAAWLYATDPGGTPLVDVTYEAVSGRPAAIRALALDHGLLAAGHLGIEGVDLDVFVMRLGGSGQIAWQVAFDLAGNQMLGDVTALADGGALIVGKNLAPGEIRTDAWVVRLDAAGAIRWQKLLSSPGDDGLQTAIETPSGDFVLAGQAGVGKQIDGFQGWVVRLDADGNLLSHQGYELGQSDRINKLVPAKRGYFGVGVAFERSFQMGQAWIVELDDDASLVESRIVGDFGFEGQDEFTDAVAIRGGGFIAVGNTDTVGGPSQQFLAAEFDGRGNARWLRHFGEGAFDVASSAIEVRGGGGSLVIAGSTQSVGTIDALQVRTGTPPDDGTACGAIGTLPDTSVSFVPQLGLPFLTVSDSAATLTASGLAQGGASATVTDVICSF